MADLRAALESLETSLAAAERKWQEARSAAEEPLTAGGKIAEPLVTYHREVRTKQRQRDDAEEQRLTDELFRQLKQDGVFLVPIDQYAPAKGFQIADRRSTFAVEAAQPKVLEARQEHDRFLAEHSDALRAADERQKMDALREALHGDDPAAVTRALEAAHA